LSRVEGSVKTTQGTLSGQDVIYQWQTQEFVLLRAVGDDQQLLNNVGDPVDDVVDQGLSIELDQRLVLLETFRPAASLDSNCQHGITVAVIISGLGSLFTTVM